MIRIFSSKRRKMHSALLIFVVLVMATCGSAETLGKCTQKPELPVKRYINYEGQNNIKLILETSTRVTHQLSTHVFKIFLEEVLGYPNVGIITRDDNFEVESTVEQLTITEVGNNSLPTSMINLEVWVPPDVDLTKSLNVKYVHESGSIRSPGRFGWFIPAELQKPLRSLHQSWSFGQDIHWHNFRDRKFVSMFDVTDANHLEYISKHMSNKDGGGYYCRNTCINGTYVPKQCENGESCALLLASHYNTTKFVVDHIEQLQLFVKVVWVGPNLQKVAERLTEDYTRSPLDKSIVILSWHPSDVIPQEKDYISVTFRHCEFNEEGESTLGCEYEMRRLVKLSWSKLEHIAYAAYHSLHKMELLDEDYSTMLSLYTKYPGKDMSELACEWMRLRPESWNNWIWKSQVKNVIYIGGIFPLANGTAYKGRGIVRAAKMAMVAINKNNTILADYELKLFLADGNCSADTVMKVFIDYIKENYFDNLAGVLGPACSDTVEPLAGVSRHYRSLVITYSAEGSSFSDRTKYPYFFRTIGENIQYKNVYLALFKKLGWARVAALTEDGQKYTEYISHLQNLLVENNITFIANSKFPRERENSAMSRYLEDLKRKRARIIIADIFDEVARSIMCDAYKLEMTAKQGYVWFLPHWLNDTWYDTDGYNKQFKEHVNCSTEEMIEAIDGHFTMTHAYFASSDSIMQENKTVGEWRKEYAANLKEQSNYGGYTYDAMWTYAYALDKLLKEYPAAISDLHSKQTTNKLVRHVQNTDFYGVSGRIKFRGGPSRFSVIDIMQWHDKKLNTIGHFTPNLTDDKPVVLNGKLELNESAIVWLTKDGIKPDDGLLPSTCALDAFASFLNVECNNAVIILNVMVFSVVIVFVITGLWIMKRRYENRVRLTEKYMKSLGIDLINGCKIAELDKWEVPRECIILNRMIGEGAFGKVYGGEANFGEEGWKAVAVKALKLGSTNEEQLDFLSEAEIMKRFEHKNIVQLLGVCAKDEPVFIIMEFMLYGDLKTFLLARRHLVNAKIMEESTEISSKKLTSMVLDIARGLSYLAEMKYVHRDLASRNCLVNQNRVVKIGDFGMTRPMFENDYYRFHRKGKLPVRWMAPESLALGVFTPSSDVWSFGVLLYEVITFGSFPYQGMSNNQVLDYVIKGNHLTIPKGVKPQLEGLLKSCWYQDSKLRPQASEIVEFLANNPRLISPCLDVPLSSVQMEDNGPLDISIPSSPFRKCSSTFSFKSSMPGGIDVDSSTSPRIFRQQSTPESRVNMQMDSYCPREPLLAPPVRANSVLGLGKFVSIHDRNDSGCEPGDHEDFFNPLNGNAISIV